MLSQRGPTAFDIDEGGALRANDAGGGLATALGGIAHSTPLRWIAAACTEGDRRAAAEVGTWRSGPTSVELTTLPPAVDELHSQGFANPLLWLIQHGLGDRLVWPRSPRAIAHAWFGGYVPANVALAQRLVEAASGVTEPIVLVQDYHLYLAPRLIRQAIPGARIAHFVHIPWPAPNVWATLPRPIVRAVLDGLMAADLVGFQTDRDVDRFLATCLTYGCNVPVGTPTAQPRPLVRPYPITVDAIGLLRSAHRADVRAVQAAAGMRTIVRVDRLDPTKNIPAGFRAFGALLDREPSLCGQVRFLAHLVPSRIELSEYQQERRAVFDAAQSVNRRFGTAQWQPVEIFFEENRALAQTLLQDYDVLLVNPVADGMNLVAKEGPVLNRRDGVLVLSETAGAWQELGVWALGIDPSDVSGTAAALNRALTMPPQERGRRASALRNKVAASSLERWLDLQLGDLARPVRSAA